METIFLFIDSSIDNVMLQSNPDFTRRFLNSYTFLNVICDILHRSLLRIRTETEMVDILPHDS